MMANGTANPLCPATRDRIGARLLAALLVAVAAIPLLASSPEKPPAAADRDLSVEVLSLSVSRLDRDAFGRAVNPFRMDFAQGEAGTVVFSKITPPPSLPLRLMEDKCRLISFKDDAATDLLAAPAAGLGNPFFSGNRPLEVLAARDPLSFGLKIRSARAPARNANRLIADVLLVFSPKHEQRAEQKADVALRTDEVVAIGPLKVKFDAGSSAPLGRPTQAAAVPQSSSWQASFLTTDAYIASVAFFAATSDEPILVVKSVNAESKASTASTTLRSGPGSPQDGFSGMRYAFTAPEDGKVTIKVRYYDSASFVEKRCVISTGLSP
jgi:hypothetical protein